MDESGRDEEEGSSGARRASFDTNLQEEKEGNRSA